MKPSEHSIGSIIKLLRTAERLTLLDVARGTGLSTVTLSEVEKGNRDPSNKTLDRIAEYYGMSVPDFYMLIKILDGRALLDLLKDLARGKL